MWAGLKSPCLGKSLRLQLWFFCTNLQLMVRYFILSSVILCVACPTQEPGTSTYCRTESYTTDNLVMLISLQCMSLDWWMNPEYLKETSEAQGEPACTMLTGQRLVSSPNPGGVRQIC